MYTEVSTMEEVLDATKRFLDMGFDVSIRTLKNGDYAISSIEK